MFVLFRLELQLYGAAVFSICFIFFFDKVEGNVGVT